MKTIGRQQTVICQICKRPRRGDEVLPGSMIRDSLVEFIRRETPDWSSDGYICWEDLNRIKTGYIRTVVATKKDELSQLDEKIRGSLHEEYLARDVDAEFQQQSTFGERMADRITSFGGSWRFLGIFMAILAVWVILNSAMLIFKPVDPYPFIFLNLILSCLATLQAPIIMMSQNRQDARDRARSQYDYRINLKAELEIRHLHEKVDYILKNQWDRMLEVQQLQMEMMEEISRRQAELMETLAERNTELEIVSGERNRG